MYERETRKEIDVLENVSSCGEGLIVGREIGLGKPVTKRLLEVSTQGLHVALLELIIDILDFI